MNEIAVLGSVVLGGAASYVLSPAAATLAPESRRPALAIGAAVTLILAAGAWEDYPELAALLAGAAVGMGVTAARTPPPKGPVTSLTIRVAGQPDVQVMDTGAGLGVAPGQGFAVGEPRPA